MARIIDSRDALQPALEQLARGEVVAIPTETVYGLAGDATSGTAVARIYEAKGRPRFNPLIAHVSSMQMAGTLAVFDPLARRLAEAFWPGPLTLVLPARDDCPVHPLARAGLATVAVRAPTGFASRLIEAFGRPLAAPSANSSGRVSATTAAAVAADLGDRVPLIVDGGPTRIGLESTIVKTQADGVRLLRPGGLTSEEIEAVVGAPLLRATKGQVEAPGMLLSHYAPRAPVRLFATRVLPGEALLAFGPDPVEGQENARAVANLSRRGDLREAAANLFTLLQDLDRSGAGTIAVAPVPGEGLGEAINDRLARAAAPREAVGNGMP